MSENGPIWTLAGRRVSGTQKRPPLAGAWSGQAAARFFSTGTRALRPCPPTARPTARARPHKNPAPTRRAIPANTLIPGRAP